MSKLFNWGSEDMEQRRIREQREFEMMLEQALNRKKMTKHAAGGGGVGGGGGAGGGFGGVAIDGPLAGAIVSANTGTAITDAAGNFTLPSKPSGPISVTGGTDTITGLPYEGELVGYAEYKTISPITTFAHYLKKASEEDPEASTLTIDEAITKTFTDSFDYFGISLPIEYKDTILQKDYIEEAIVNNNKVGISAQAVGTLIEAIAETLGVALDSSQQADTAKKAGKVIAEFSLTNRKRSAYKALGRQAHINGAIAIESITEEIKFYDPVNQEEVIGVSFGNAGALSAQLKQTISELATLAKQEQYTNNYLTTRIQAVNRAQKTIIKNEVKSTVEDPRGLFSNIVTVSTSKEVEDALRQIEKGKSNETAPTLDGTAQTIELPLFYQIKKDIKSGQEVDTLLTFPTNKIYFYFGTTKDLPILMQAIPPIEPGGDITYTAANFPYTADKTTTDTAGILLDAPCTIKTESVDKETGITTTTTYTFRPFVSYKTGKELKVGLRLSSIGVVETKPELVTHIADSGTYEPSYINDNDNIVIIMAASIKGTPDGNSLDITTEFAGSVLFKLLPTKFQGEFILNKVDGKAGTETTVATGIKFNSVNVATFFYTVPGLKGDDVVTWTISYTTNAK